MADELKIDKFEPFIPTANQIQYLNPVQHREFLSCIAEVVQKQTAEELSGALAASLRVDGSVDQQQVDNKHVCIQIVTSNGELIHRFPASWAWDSRIFAVCSRSIQSMEWCDHNHVLHCHRWRKYKFRWLQWSLKKAWRRKVSKRSKSWTTTENMVCCSQIKSCMQRRNKDSDHCFWCSECWKLLSCFWCPNTRWTTTTELLHWPSFKEVRFAEFSHHLFAVFLRNYRCCMSYWEKENDESTGFLCKWKTRTEYKRFVSWLMSHFERITEELTKRHVYAERVMEAKGENNQGTWKP